MRLIDSQENIVKDRENILRIRQSYYAEYDTRTNQNENTESKKRKILSVGSEDSSIEEEEIVKTLNQIKNRIVLEKMSYSQKF